MAQTVLTPPDILQPPGAGGYGGGGGGDNNGGHGDYGEGSAPGFQAPGEIYRTGMWMALVAILMFFAAFASAMVVRRGISKDWVPLALPRVLYLNTAVLLASSVTLELSRNWLRVAMPARFLRALYATLLLGVAFIAGQFAAWKQLAERGVYLTTNPSSSFFYLFTAAHGLHLIAGLIALAYVSLVGHRIAFGIKNRTVLDVTAIYWHFMAGLWVCILLLLLFR